jgi:hypothetical protein
MGSCQVYKIIPDADVALNWTPSAGGTGFNLINEVTPDDDGSYISARRREFPQRTNVRYPICPLRLRVCAASWQFTARARSTAATAIFKSGRFRAASTGLGSDRPITTAYTYWADVFDADPNGGIAWTRLSVNAMNLQINRTV